MINIYKHHNEPETLAGDSDIISFEFFFEERKFLPRVGINDINDIANSKTLAYYYAEYTDKPFPEGEKAISSDAGNSYNYAKDVLHAPFPKGEKAISTRGQYSYQYAHTVLKAPFPKGEEAIASNDYYSYLYAFDVLKAPFPKGEPAIAKDSVHSLAYAKNVLKAPFEAATKLLYDSEQWEDYLTAMDELGFEI